MGTSFAESPIDASRYSLHRRLFPRFSLPGNLTIDEELEEVQALQAGGSSISIGQFTRKRASSSQPKSEIGALMTTDQRRNSYMSASISRSYSDAGTPNVGALTAERESMRTPRPLTSESPKTNHSTLMPDSAFVNRRKEASDATIEAKNATHHLEGSSQNNSPTRISSEVGVKNTTEYSANSLGKASVASSTYTGRQSGSEYGDRSAFSTSSAARKAKKKGVAPPEVLVIVRPPPSKQVNPLNLQIQLVIPQSQSTAATSRTSLDSSRDDTSVISASQSTGSSGLAHSTSSNLTALTPTKPTMLRRSSSTHSARSSRSEASSGGMSSYSSTTGASRRVTPLYNLNFHSITATTVTDAGTDDKVAKFGKRGVEIDGFGQLEPHELICGVNDLVSLQERRRSSIKGPLALGAQSQKSASNINLNDAMSEVSRTRSRQGGSPSIPTRASTEMGAPVQLRPNEEPPTSFDAMSPEAKNPTEGGILGGKFLSKFKRFSINPATNTASSKNSTYSFGSPSRTGTGATDASNVASVFSKVTSAAVNKIKETSGGATSTVGLSDEQSEIISAKESMISMGAQPNGISIETPQLIVGGGLRADSRRTEGYYWTIRKWNRRNAQEDVEEGGAEAWHKEAGNNPILNSVWKRFNIVNRMGGQEMHPACRDVPVRFEWTRNTDRRKSSAVSSGHGRAANESSGAKAKLANMPRSSFSRPSTDTKTGGDALKPPKSNSRPSSIYSNMSAHRRSTDAGSQAGSQFGSVEDGEMSDPEDSETVWACHLVLGPTTRIPIGSLTPTPHHPKLVGQLTIPFPLPDLSQSGLGTDGAGLTREELKDIISVTCLFVVIREGFGGLVKKRR